MKMLFSAYRLDQYPDPDGFMAQAALILSEYPEEVIAYVTDPRTGIQRTQKFPPTIEEIARACNDKVAAIERRKALDEWHERKRASDEVRARDGRRADDVKPGQYTYGEFLEKFPGQVPLGRFESGTA